MPSVTRQEGSRTTREREVGSSTASAVGSLLLPDGSLFNPRRLRSAGPLEAKELAFCREHGIPLAYDPVQIGWVTRDCVDDLFPSDSEDPPAADLRSEDRHSIHERFEERASARVQDHLAGRLGRAEADGAIWSLAEQLVQEPGPAEEMAGAEKRELIRVLQRRANRLINEHLVPPGARDAKRQEALAGADRNVLRPWNDAEAPRFVELLDNPSVWRYLPEDYPNPLTESLARDLIHLSNDSNHHEVCAIERAGTVVGQIRMLFDGGKTSAADDAEISYWLGETSWGHGIVGEVIPLYTYLTFRKRESLTSTFARVDAANTASRRALERAGYRFEGRLAAELEGEPGMCTYRCFREDYFAPEPTATGPA